MKVENKLMGHKGYKGSVEFSETDGVYFGKLMEIRGLVSYEGKTREELEDSFRDAVDEFIELCGGKE